MRPSPQVKDSSTTHIDDGVSHQPSSAAISVDTTDADLPAFALCGPNVIYRFHVHPSGDLVHDYFGPPTHEHIPHTEVKPRGWRPVLTLRRREFPDVGRGDFRMPAIHIRHGTGHTVSAFRYSSYQIVEGKPALEGLPHTIGEASEVSTLIVKLQDTHAGLTAELSYSIFPACDAIVRSFKITNHSNDAVVLERAAISVDMPREEWEMVHLCGEWGHEAQVRRRGVEAGVQG